MYLKCAWIAWKWNRVLLCVNFEALELVGPNKRVLCGTLIHGFFTLGLLYQSGAAYVLKHWQWIDLAIAVPLVFYIAYYW